MRQKLLFIYLIVAMPLALYLLADSTTLAQIVEKPRLKEPVKLEALIPKLDTSNPEEAKLLKGGISDTYNPEILEIPRSGSGKVYEVGLKLYNQGDYNRALNAFKLAMIRAAKFGLNDPRVKNAKAAIKSTEAKLNMQARLGYKTDAKESNSLIGKVEKVFQPSLAWLGGLREGDRITKSRIENDLIKLTVTRNGKTYQISLKLGKAKSIDLKAMVAKKGNVTGFGGPLDGGAVEYAPIKNIAVVEKNEKLLASYDCALLIDNSASMGGVLVADGADSLRLTKWDWCKKNCLAFSSLTGKYFPRGITLVPFNSQFAVARGAGSREITKVFDSLKPQAGTNIAGPLAFVIDDYFQRRARGSAKPMAIAVMTDGEDSFSIIRDVIVDATTRMKHPREIKITFLTISSRSFGSPTLKALDDKLLDVGAAYDIVDTRSFAELEKYGLTKMIVAALVEGKAEGK